jgi:hypothetical protein
MPDVDHLQCFVLTPSQSRAVRGHDLAALIPISIWSGNRPRARTYMHSLRSGEWVGVVVTARNAASCVAAECISAHATYLGIGRVCASQYGTRTVRRMQEYEPQNPHLLSRSEPCGSSPPVPQVDPQMDRCSSATANELSPSMNKIWRSFMLSYAVIPVGDWFTMR